MIEEQIEIATRDGQCDCFVCYPDANQRYPAVILYMDAMGMRGELRDMARRLAASGYLVLLPNLYYRSVKGDIVIDADRIEEEGPDQALMWTLNRSIYNPLVVADSRAFLDRLNLHPAVLPGPRGVCGYCMSGRYVVAVAGAYPDEIAFAASYYGVRIVDDHAQSAHLSLPEVKAHLYLAFAEFDTYVSDANKAQLLAILDSSGVDYQCETYAGAHHGFVFPERALYHAGAAARHWATLVGLCEKYLDR